MAAADFWDERYAGEAFAYGEAPNAFLASLADRFPAGGRALVPGDGEGRNGVFLATLGMRVETLDLSPLGVAKARRLAAARGVTLQAQQADVLSWGWPVAAYDLIALLYLHLPEAGRRALHAHALAALKPGGLIVLEAFTPRQIDKQRAGARGGPRDAALLYEPADLRADFAGAEIELCQEIETELGEGTLHVGPSAVARLVARRA
ncbi:MAG: methyltransferase domain-containing protein [Pseudomonadota bacterium]|nr:methyltransferase domain-containing protein [Pseudomonadota bacterium]